MKVYDFEYDGLVLSDMGYMLCEFDFNGTKTISNGSQITFNTIKTSHGQKQELVSIEYAECIGTTLQICKNPCAIENTEITIDELRQLTRWLNRKGFFKFKLLAPEYYDFYFEATFNVSKIEIGGRLYGIQLQMVTNRPFAISEPITIKINNSEPYEKHTIHNISDEEGSLDVYAEIKVLQDGDLIIRNGFTDKQTVITNCKKDEIITMNNPVITSSLSHKLQNDFNWNYIKLFNTFTNRKNDFTISLPCEIKLTYYPIIKVGI